MDEKEIPKVITKPKGNNKNEDFVFLGQRNSRANFTLSLLFH